MTICYFTASGNSLYVARQIGGRLLSIPKLMKEESIDIEDDAIGIVSPVYVLTLRRCLMISNKVIIVTSLLEHLTPPKPIRQGCLSSHIGFDVSFSTNLIISLCRNFIVP